MGARRLALLVLLSTAGCGSACPGEDPSHAASAPSIDDLSALSDVVAGDPWEVALVADFHDADGDLGDGVADVFLGGRSKPTELQLLDAFRGSAVALDATQGRLTLPLRFSDTVHDGSDVRVGLELVDGAGQRSNCYSLELHFAVQQLAGRVERGARGLWARL